MSAETVVALVGVVLSLLLAISGRILNGISHNIQVLSDEVKALREKLSEFVLKTDCGREMEGHCQRLDSLRQQVEANERHLLVIDTKLKLKEENQK